MKHEVLEALEIFNGQTVQHGMMVVGGVKVGGINSWKSLPLGH